MRTVMLMIGGLADAAAEGSGHTALEVARTPVLDGLAMDGILGLTRLVPADGVATTTATLLGALGYEADAVDLAPGAAVALGLGAAVPADDLVAVLDLVTAGVDEAGVEIVSAVGGAHLDRADRCALTEVLAEALRPHGVEVFPGPEAAVALRPGGLLPRSGPPWAALGRPLAGDDRDARLRRVARDAIQNAPVVVSRRTGGAPVPTDVWVWGPGRIPRDVPPFPESGVLLADEPAPLGVARAVGLDTAALGAPEQADGWGDAAARIAAAVDQHVLTVAYVDAVDAAAHRGDAGAKAAMIEAIDREMLAPLREALGQRGGDWRLAVVAGHVANTGSRAHEPEPVPFVVYASRPEHRTPHARRAFSERDAREQGIFIPDGQGLISRLLRR